ncbi:MAG: ribose 5-phosphate isomerase B [Leptospirillum sp.]|jgi:ribose 5-phosphate isomerase B|nr:ribose 5-phosphate isomerase B [Nitrospiraceae bacterium]
MTEKKQLPPIAIGSDHAGFELKNNIIRTLSMSGYTVTNCGTDGPESVDYPDFAEKVATIVTATPGTIGVLICGTGIGMSIAANKHHGIRAALVYNEETAALAHEHNNANILCLGARELSPEKALTLVSIFLDSAFENGRHQRRIDKISALDH